MAGARPRLRAGHPCRSPPPRVLTAPLVAAEHNHGNLAAGGGTVSGEAWICCSHFVEQRRTFLAPDNAGPSGESLAIGFNGHFLIGGGIQVPRWMMVPAVVRSDDDQIARLFELKVQQWRRSQLATPASPGHEDEYSLAFQPAQNSSVGDTKQ